MVTSTTYRLDAALEKRARMSCSKTNVQRLIHDEGDGFPGLTADRLARAILVEAHKREADPETLVRTLEDRLGEKTPIFLKKRWAKGEAESGWQVAGPICHSELTVQEDGLFYGVKLTGSEHIGLFLDSRPARQRVLALAGGKRVLNLFSYTGAFGVCAASGGAVSTTNVDNKRSALAQARRNYRLNTLPHDTRTFLRADAFQFLQRAVKGRGRFDLIILDPPPVSKGSGRRRFRVETGYAGLAAKCLRLLTPGGRLFAGLNGSRVRDTMFQEILFQAAEEANRTIELVEHIGPGEDFPECRNRPVARFVLALCKN